MSKLEDTILATKLPAWAIAAATTPFTFAASYLAFNQPGDSILDAPPAAVAAVVALAASCPVKWHFQDKATLNELGIDENSFQNKVGETRKKSIAKKSLELILKPQAAAAVLATALEAGRLHFAGANSIGMETAITAVFGVGSYYFVKPIYWALGNGGKSHFIKFLKAALSKGQSQTRQLEAIAEEHPTQYILLNLADSYLESGDFDKAAYSIKKAASSDQQQMFPGMGLRDFVSSIVTYRYRKWKKDKGDVPYAIEVANFCNQAGSYAKADEIIRAMTQENRSAEAAAMAAWWAGNAFGRQEEAKHHWRQAAERLIRDGSYAIAPSGEGIHRVYRIGPKFIQDDIILKEETLADAEFESRMLGFVAGIPKDAGYTSPAELAIVRNAADYLLVMSYLRGKSLLEKARDGEATHEDIRRALDYLALLHQYIPVEMSAKGKIDFRKKLEAMAGSSHLGMPDEWQRRITGNMEFIADGLNGTVNVFSQDAHAGQWQYTQTQLAKLDHNDNGIDSLFRDLAKLSGHPVMGLDAEALEQFQHYAFTAYRNIPLTASNEIEFRIRHLDAMLFQALSFAAAWSVPEMKHMRELRVPAISMAAVAIERIKENHNARYRQNRLQYDGALSGMEELKEKLAA